VHALRAPSAACCRSLACFLSGRVRLTTPAPPHWRHPRLFITGEKKLRALLNKTPEWNSADAREAAAVACDESADSASRALAVALRAKSCASLRKAHLFRLCGAWGYACNLWHNKEGRRGDAPRVPPLPAAGLAPPAAAAPLPPRPLLPTQHHPAAPAFGAPPPHALALATSAPPAAAAAGALVPSGDAGAAGAAGAAAGRPPGWDYGAFGGELALAPDAAAEHIMAHLRPMALECAWTFEGAAAREAAERLGAEHITPRVVDALSKVTRWLHRLLLEWGQQHATVLAWSRRLAQPGGAEEGRQLAWAALAKPGAAFSLEEALALIASLAQTSVAACAEKQRVPDCTPSEAAWLAEFGAGSLMGLEVIVRLQALLAQFKFASLSTFLGVTARVLELGMLATSSVAANFTARDAWMREMLAANQRASSAGALDARAGGDAGGAGDTAASTRRLELFEFSGFPERVSSGVLLLEPGDA
jgi:hypothetical protein